MVIKDLLFRLNADDSDARKKLASLKKEIEKIESSIAKKKETKSGITASLENARAEAKETGDEIKRLQGLIDEGNKFLSVDYKGKVSPEERAGVEELVAKKTQELERQQKIYEKQTSVVGQLETKEKSLTEQISQQTKKLEEMQGEQGKLEKRLSGAGSYKKLDFSGLKRGIDEAKDKMKVGFKTILKYAFGIRSLFFLFRKLKNAIKEGVNAFAESDSVFKATLDSLKAGLNGLKVSWGAAFAPIIEMVAPLLNRLISLLTIAADKVNAFFSALGGKSSYKAVRAGQESIADGYKSAGGAAKEAEKEVAGFDEITKLGADKSGGGGGGGSGVGAGVEERQLPEFFQNLKDAFANGDFGAIAGLLSGKLNVMLHNVAEKIREFDFGEFARNLFGGFRDFLDGFDIGGVMGNLSDIFVNIVNGIADFINGATDTGLIDSIGNFISRAISGIEIGKILSSLTNLIMTLIFNIPIILMRLLANVSDIIGGLFEALGMDSVAGFFYGIAEKIRTAATWLKENFVNPIIKCIKDTLGIHSPSTVFASIGQDVVQGFINGFKEKWQTVLTTIRGFWDKLVNWWRSLTLPSFHIPSPHFSWTYTQASGLIAKALEFVGLPATIPHLNIAWYAKGGIVDGATLFGAGENGKEAVVPLERNTEWIDMVAKGMVDNIVGNNRLADYISGRVMPAIVNGSLVPPRALSGGGSMLTDGDIQKLVSGITAALGEGSGESVIKLYIDGRELAEAVTKHQRQMARGTA